MVGGEGVRLRPLTKNIPKPMLYIGNKPILQTIIEKFADHGYVNIVMCLNYKFQIIKNFFGDGKKFGVKIEYVIEKKKLGTVGALSLLKKKLTKPFFLMNGDLLTDVNFEYIHNYHKLKNNIATICVKEHNVELPYGVVKLNQNLISSFEEKPNYKFFINAGVYMFSPEVLNHIPRNKKYQISELFIKLVKLKKKINTFNLKNYWLDIGQVEQLNQAKKEFNKIF
jgi:NDP-sugar pyrophosphorylase family protein